MDKIRLKEHHKHFIELDGLNERIEKLEYRLDGVGAQKISDEIKSGKTKELPDKLAHLVDLKNKRDDLIKLIDDEEVEIENTISKLDDPIERALMRYKYLNNNDFEEIADKVKYSVRSIERKHGEALKKLFG